MNDQKTSESRSPDTSPTEELQPETPSAAAAPSSAEESAAAAEHAPEPPPSPPEKRRSGGAWIAVLALLLAVVAAAGSAYLWQRLETLAGGQADLQPRLDAARSETEAALDALRREVERLEQSRANLERARQNDFGTVAELSQRVARAEQAVAGQQGVSVAARESWVLAEVEYYLRIANERLQLARDADSAQAALQLADTRLTELDDPAFTPVRAAIAEELLALQNLARPDITGISLNLGSLADRVSSLPLRSRPEATADSEAEQPEAAGTGWQRAADAVGSAIKGLVSVRRSDEDIEPLLAPRERFFLYRNLELKLQLARIALLERDPAGFRDHLRGARGWLITYFDVEDARVRDLMDTLADLETREIAPAVPDLSASLRALRQAQTRIGNE
jgi:uroporphyrin-3 C-methyltransferase